ncbi:hypothetical protein [Flavobacterium sp. I3-2]|uniref:hypothetical protein n=1 Tax=Flavobacterium sp. I3-2 TaxID=2748319 RepID=UPI0015A97771|nr:hypothetical protein [Flavobacterium sp. I3-2]
MDLINKILKNKINYFIILISIILYIRQENRILDFPIFLNYTFFLILFFVLFFINNKHSKEIKRKSFLHQFFNILALIVFAILFTTMLKIPLNFAIIKLTNGNQIERICQINNYFSGRMEKIYFIFDGKKQSIRFKNEKHLTREDIIKNYMIKLNYKNSIFGTKVIESYQLIKNKNTVHNTNFTS